MQYISSDFKPLDCHHAEAHKRSLHLVSFASLAGLTMLVLALILAGCQYVPGNPYFKNSDAEFDTMDNLLFAQQEMDERIKQELDKL